MNWVDFVILGILLVSTLISLVRGFAREALSLLVWAAAFWVAITYSESLEALFVDHINTPSVRLALAFFALFLATLVAGGLVNFLIGQLVDKTGLSGTDRVLGMVFGAARGVAVVALLVLLAGLTPLPQDPWWQDSMLLPHFQMLAIWIREFLPPDIGGNIVFG
ncbi:CvpA family protein [Thioalbus denitrificans]|uniref:Membrane protein required for colicin V production n=1 Tax=Thioalbus denitrificans TaxID=547122 RepID=A0A369CF34_9GAMM|nr:CvpA family protein [Thioalbus denitrificans]RCX32171.1 membrane protein required for colicin V production [Thioalbus denitrificans]